nr:membrane-bound lytic transglycosylase F [Klebsiella pneumoniae]
MPVSRDNLFIALNEGKGDIAAANLTITPSREAQVDFAQPLYSNVKELLISGPASPKVDSPEQLSGQTVFVRRSSSYYDSLQALNARFAGESRPPVILEAAPEALEDEDLLEMLNAGLIPLIVVDQHKALFWKQVFPKFRSMTMWCCATAATLPGGTQRQPAAADGTEQLRQKNRQGTTLGNTLLLRYLKMLNMSKCRGE